MNERIGTLRLSPQDLAMLGIQDMAFIKRVEGDAGAAYTIHAADGTPMGQMMDRDVAFAAVRQHGLEPVSVH